MASGTAVRVVKPSASSGGAEGMAVGACPFGKAIIRGLTGRLPRQKLLSGKRFPGEGFCHVG